MKLIIGLGNPGSQYFNTRHNFGFLALNHFQDATLGFSIWQKSEKFKSLISEGEVAGEKIILAKPQTMMNLSGQAVKSLADFYKVDSPNIWILHDDLDLPLGALRLSQNSSAAGHKGIESVIKELGTKDFIRFRLGITPQKHSVFSALTKIFMPAEKFVLRKFSEAEKKEIQTVTEKVKKSILFALRDGVAKAQNQFN